MGKHPAFTPMKRRDGKVVGTLPRVSGVGHETGEILSKLNFGGRRPNHLWNGKPSIPNFKNAIYQKNNFMEEGWSKAQSSVINSLTKRYESLLHKAVNRANIKAVAVKRAV